MSGDGVRQALGWLGSDEARAVFRALLSLVLMAAWAYIATHPEVIEDAWYRVRLWYAYRQAAPNVDRLRHMRALRWAGYYDSDLVAAPEDA